MAVIEGSSHGDGSSVGGVGESGPQSDDAGSAVGGNSGDMGVTQGGDGLVAEVGSAVRAEAEVAAQEELRVGGAEGGEGGQDGLENDKRYTIKTS